MSFIGKFGVLTFFFIMTLVGACQAAPLPSEQAARRFMQHYYVDTDLRQALSDADGYAREKIHGSVKLTEGQTIDASAHRPKISVSLLESTVEGPEASYLFQVEVRPEKMNAIRKKTLLKVREREGGAWKVTQFVDFEMEKE